MAGNSQRQARKLEMYGPRRARGEWEQIAPRKKGQGKVTDPVASRQLLLGGEEVPGRS